ncbi:SAM-dependent methyltransferase [Allostreptomyces psammosilenae]|uniref:SAM-dependent methyltransferase n=1 Tax=Allostreptomyces psammosilenae TaxID=1892865 RepID=UPI002483FA97
MPLVELRTEIGHPARMYDYYLGGKDNFPADRELAEQALAVEPRTRLIAQVNRAFLQRAVRAMAASGIRQFLDIGTGIPTAGNTHEVAQEVAPDARVVYVDNDPIVLVHARALMSSTQEGRTTVIQEDLRSPEAIVNSAEVRELIDFDQPLGLILVAVLHFITDADGPHEIVERLKEALPSGSQMALSHLTADFAPPGHAERAVAPYQRATAPLIPRSRPAVERFFTGLELQEPGLVVAPLWRPDGELPPDAEILGIYAGLGVKP